MAISKRALNSLRNIVAGAVWTETMTDEFYRDARDLERRGLVTFKARGGTSASRRGHDVAATAAGRRLIDTPASSAG